MKEFQTKLPPLAWISFLLASSALHAAPKIVWQSDFGGPAFQSDGATPLDAGFTFELGAFKDDFVPTFRNRGEWSTHWVALQSTSFSEFARAFSQDINFVNNEVPFVAGGKAYIWGYQSKDVSDEWVLLTNAEWKWPIATAGAPTPGTEIGFLVADLSGADAIVGSVNENGIHLRTSLPPPPLISFEEWLADYFNASEQADPLIGGKTADPDKDGHSNLLEYAMGSDPLSPVIADRLQFNFQPDGEDSFLEVIIQRSPTANVSWVIEESSTMDVSSFEEITTGIKTVKNTPGELVFLVSLPHAQSPSKFFRIRITETFK